LSGKPLYLSEVARIDLQQALLNYERQNAVQAVDGCLDALASRKTRYQRFLKAIKKGDISVAHLF
jgi:hypothetical protein